MTHSVGTCIDRRLWDLRKYFSHSELSSIDLLHNGTVLKLKEKTVKPSKIQSITLNGFLLYTSILGQNLNQTTGKKTYF